MTITENKTPNSLELVISGRLDTGTAPELEAKLKQISKDTQSKKSLTVFFIIHHYDRVSFPVFFDSGQQPDKSLI